MSSGIVSSAPAGWPSLPAARREPPAPDSGIPDPGIPDAGIPDSGIPDSGLEAAVGDGCGPAEAPAYDDFLGLDGASLRHLRLLVLTGRSGSGKSTTLAHLVDSHPSFRERPRTWIQHHAEPGGRRPAGRLRLDSSRSLEGLVVVDELLAPADLVAVAGLLRDGHTVLAASHVPPAWLLPLRARWPARVLRTDRCPDKIVRFLHWNGISATACAVERFCRRYGATYTDCEIVLEWDGGRDFDRALARFDACCRIELGGGGGSEPPPSPRSVSNDYRSRVPRTSRRRRAPRG